VQWQQLPLFVPPCRLFHGCLLNWLAAVMQADPLAGSIMDGKRLCCKSWLQWCLNFLIGIVFEAEPPSHCKHVFCRTSWASGCTRVQSQARSSWQISLGGLWNQICFQRPWISFCESWTTFLHFLHTHLLVVFFLRCWCLFF
jgi:hypothetical protein